MIILVIMLVNKTKNHYNKMWIQLINKKKHWIFYHHRIQIFLRLIWTLWILINFPQWLPILNLIQHLCIRHNHIRIILNRINKESIINIMKIKLIEVKINNLILKINKNLKVPMNLNRQWFLVNSKKILFKIIYKQVIINAIKKQEIFHSHHWILNKRDHL